MPTYIVAGASRGIGLEFVRQYALDPKNTVFGLVRDVSATQKRYDTTNVKNVHFLQADITNIESLDRAAAEVAKISPSVDYLINNAAILGPNTFFGTLADFKQNPSVLQKDLIDTYQTNVVGMINTTNAFLDLVRKSSTKKVITISSPMGETLLPNEQGVWEGAAYSISKAALNMMVAKYNASLKHEGILFLALSPGVVETGNDVEGFPEERDNMGKKFLAAYPDWQGPLTTEQSIKAMDAVIEKSALINGDGGAHLSHWGNKQWL